MPCTNAGRALASFILTVESGVSPRTARRTAASSVIRTVIRLFAKRCYKKWHTISRDAHEHHTPPCVSASPRRSTEVRGDKIGSASSAEDDERVLKSIFPTIDSFAILLGFVCVTAYIPARLLFPSGKLDPWTWSSFLFVLFSMGSSLGCRKIRKKHISYPFSGARQISEPQTTRFLFPASPPGAHALCRLFMVRCNKTHFYTAHPPLPVWREEPESNNNNNKNNPVDL